MSFETKIEAITQITIDTTATVPTQSEVTDFLNEGIKDLTNKIVFKRIKELVKNK